MEKSKREKYWPQDFLTSLAAILKIETISLVLLAIYLVFAPFFSHTTHPTALIAQIIFSILGAGALWISRKSFLKGRTFGRGIALLANGIGLGVSYFAAKGGAYIVAIPLAFLSATALLLIFLVAKRAN